MPPGFPVAGAVSTACAWHAAPVQFETPAQLLARLKLGREEYCQRLLTTLLLHAPYPRWNTRSMLAPEGGAFLRDLHELSFGTGWPDGAPAFIDEFELPPRTDAEKGGAPDYAVVWRDRLWLIELKTEKGSHRAAQVPGYFELAHHHYPEAHIDLTYVAPMDAPYQPEGEWARYAHVTWEALPDLLRSHWPAPTTPGQQEVLDGLLATIDSLHLTPMEWRTALGAVTEVAVPMEIDEHDTAKVPGAPPIDDIIELAAATAEDRRQRSVDFLPADLDDLLALRVAVRERLAASPPDSPLRRVMPWIWQAASMGGPMTTAGREVGMELRLSRYPRSLYG